MQKIIRKTLISGLSRGILTLFALSQLQGLQAQENISEDKTYHLDTVHGHRLAATGSSEDAFGTGTNVTTNDTRWKFVRHSSGLWHLQLENPVGDLARIRTDRTETADMQATSSSGTFTQYEITPSTHTDGAYYLTLPNAPDIDYSRLKINNFGVVQMTNPSNYRSQESFFITEAGDMVASQIIPADQDTTDNSLIALGPLGFRVKTDQRDQGHPRSTSNSGTVQYIFQNSLAVGRVQIGDEIIGINGQTFNGNFTSLVSREIDKSEGSDGRVVLRVRRGSQIIDVTINIPIIGSYSSSWPYNDEKSAKILENACDWLVEHQQPSGKFERNQNSSDLVLSSASGLALLGADKEKYREPLERLAEGVTNHLEDRIDSNGHYRGGILDGWSVSYVTMFLSEYYFRYQDEDVKETLRFLSDEIHWRQFRNLDEASKAHMIAHLTARGNTTPFPEYWFGHGRITPTSGGYIHMGCGVANAVLAWSLAEKAGVDVDSENLENTLDYVEIAAPLGRMTYAAGPNQRDTPNDAFGRTGNLGLALHIRNNRPSYTNLVKDSLNGQYSPNYYRSHATAVMGKAWGTIAIANLDPDEFRQMMDEMQEDYDLLRLSDGSFVTNRSSHDLLQGGSGDRHRWTTAFNALIYAIGQRKLFIAGALIEGDENLLIEAEDYSSRFGVNLRSADPGFTGTGFMDYGGNGTWVEWDGIEVSDDNWRTSFRYAIGTSASRQCEVIVNGASQGVVTFPSTGSWSTWETVGFDVDLNPVNTIRLESVGAGPNLDSITIESAGDLGVPFAATSYTAESNPTDNGLVRNLGTKVGFIRNGTWIRFDDFDFGPGASRVEVSASSARAGGTIQIRTGSATGTLLGSILVSNTGGWNNFQSFSTALTQSVSGVNDLYLVFVGGAGALLDVESFQFN